MTPEGTSVKRGWAGSSVIKYLKGKCIFFFSGIYTASGSIKAIGWQTKDFSKLGQIRSIKHSILLIWYQQKCNQLPSTVCVLKSRNCMLWPFKKQRNCSVNVIGLIFFFCLKTVSTSSSYLLLLALSKGVAAKTLVSKEIGIQSYQLLTGPRPD